MLCAFDLIELDGNDLRRTPIEERKDLLAKLLNRPQKGIAFNQHYLCYGAVLFLPTPTYSTTLGAQSAAGNLQGMGCASLARLWRDQGRP